MKPQHEFGKEAFEKEEQRKLKRKKMKRVAFITTVTVILLSAILLFRSDLQSMVASSSTELSKKEKKNKKDAEMELSASQQNIVTEGVSIGNKWDLPSSLKEISGISFIGGDRLACVQDENGKVFIYNLSTKKIEKEIPFGADGDYEGIAVVNESVWVVRSDGQLFEIKDINSSKQSVSEVKTSLTEKHNIEGLGYDKANNRLLLATKDETAENKGFKAIYEFNLSSRKLESVPVFKISMTDAAFEGIKSKNEKEVFMPSSITVHPESGDMYLTDGRNPKLLILHPSGKIRKLFVLDKKEFAQPEGIAINEKGELYISNEGPKAPPNILQVNIK